MQNYISIPEFVRVDRKMARRYNIFKNVHFGCRNEVFMPVRIHNFAGIIGWNARKYLPRLASESYLKLQFITRRKLQKKYIDYFLQNNEIPQPNIINIETINRCNSTCEFCTANHIKTT